MNRDIIHAQKLWKSALSGKKRNKWVQTDESLFDEFTLDSFPFCNVLNLYSHFRYEVFVYKYSWICEAFWYFLCEYEAKMHSK